METDDIRGKLYDINQLSPMYLYHMRTYMDRYELVKTAPDGSQFKEVVKTLQEIRNIIYIDKLNYTR